jgi:hypothetical protein
MGVTDSKLLRDGAGALFAARVTGLRPQGTRNKRCIHFQICCAFLVAVFFWNIISKGAKSVCLPTRKLVYLSLQH